MALAWWLVPCLPFPGLPHIYFLFTVQLINEWLGVFLARRSVQHLVSFENCDIVTSGIGILNLVILFRAFCFLAPHTLKCISTLLFIGMFLWSTLSEFVILVPIWNSTWLLVVWFDWLRCKDLFFKTLFICLKLNMMWMILGVYYKVCVFSTATTLNSKG
jgi:hypothetical protein